MFDAAGKTSLHLSDGDGTSTTTRPLRDKVYVVCAWMCTISRHRRLVQVPDELRPCPRCEMMRNALNCWSGNLGINLRRITEFPCAFPKARQICIECSVSPN